MIKYFWVISLRMLVCCGVYHENCEYIHHLIADIIIYNVGKDNMNVIFDSKL